MTAYAHPESLTSTEWLADHLGQRGLRIVDASWYLPAQARDPLAEFRARHIPGAVFFPLDQIAEPDTDLPHMLPSPEQFAEAAGALGIGSDDQVVVYDGTPMMSAPRIWWTFRVFGHQRVSVLDGGFPKWLREDRPTESGDPSPSLARYSARFRPEMVRSLAQMRANLDRPQAQVVDARAAPRFKGEEPDLWPGRRRGHIPGSRNLPYGTLLDPQSMTMLPAEQIAEKFRGAGLTQDRPVITTCGSGVTAAVLAFGLHLIGREDVALYDGSWAEWGRPGDTPVEI